PGGEGVGDGRRRQPHRLRPGRRPLRGGADPPHADDDDPLPARAGRPGQRRDGRDRQVRPPHPRGARARSPAAGATRLSEAKPASQLPEVGRFWIRYVPKSWEAAERPWIHLAGAALGDWGKGKPRGAEAAVPAVPLDDVLYVPPVPPRRAAARDELARERLMAGTPVLVQLLPGEESTVPPVAGAAFVIDLLQ